MQTIHSSDNWSEVQAFWISVIGLHDSLLTDVKCSETAASITLNFEDILTHSSEGGFRLAYPKLKLLLSGVDVSQVRRLLDVVGNDVVASELLPSELWISTLGGSFAIPFKSLRFIIP